MLWLSLFFVLLIGLPVLAELMPSQTMAMVDSFYRVGSLVFGGGHVVLPLLQAEVVPSGWVNNESFLAGYSSSGARPFVHVRRVSWCLDEHRPVGLDRRHCVSAGYLRALVLAGRRINAILGAFAPQYRHQAALAGINAAVVGLLLAALYQPVWTSAIFQPQDFGLALVPLSHLCSGSSRRGWLSSVAVQLGGC